jgi:AAA+ superfamily predicted ATPase
MGAPARAAKPVQAPFSAPDPVELVLRRVRLRAKRRAVWLRSLWAAEPASHAGVVTHAEADASLDGRDDEAEERRWVARDSEARALTLELGQVEKTLSTLADSRFDKLAAVFGLDERERDVVEVCLAAALEPGIARALAYLHDNAERAHPSEPLVRRLFDHGYRRVLVPESPLVRWSLVREETVAPAEPAALVLDPALRDWLVGADGLDAALVGVARLQRALEPLPGWPVDALTSLFERAMSGEGAGRARVCLLGPPGSGRRTLAANVAARLQLLLLVVDSDAVSDEDWPRVFLRAQRQAYLDGCALAWSGEGALRRRLRAAVPDFPVQFVIAEAGQLPDSAAFEAVMALPSTAPLTRAALWKQHVPEALAWPESELAALASQHRVTPGEIASVGARCPASAAEAAALVRESTRHRLGELAEWLECPFGWDDLVVPDALRRALGDFVFEAGDRAAFWEDAPARRLFPQGRGLFALFTGPPGTGKTMAAQVLAKSLGLDLFRISLSAVVSKWVGETAKNLARVLSRAAAMDAILFFDEADALFGRRTEIKDAQDRFANTETNYLLQAVEAYPGIVVLATNKKANIDAAFARRLRYVLEFPRPDAEQRKSLWRRLVAELAGAERADQLRVELDSLAQSVDCTGAQIKLAVLGALFASRQDRQPLALAHVLHGLERELLKEGRALSERERERLGRS